MTTDRLDSTSESQKKKVWTRPTVEPFGSFADATKKTLGLTDATHEAVGSI